MGDRALATPRERFGTADDETWLWALGAGRREDPELRELLPGLPPEDIQVVTNGNAGDEALLEGFRIYRGFRSIYEQRRGDLEPATVLDFGCGWGRVIRFFLKDVDPDRLWGVDATESSIAICRETSRWGNFRTVDPYPPAELEAGTFDLIYAYSVFSHLPEDLHVQWLDEFTRILKPDGLLIATTRERGFIDRNPAYFKDGAEWKARYDRGEFCFDTTEAYGAGSDRYGEACIPEEYVRREWARRFEVLDFVSDLRISEQNIVVAQPQLA